jgi:hypothetical protein
VSDGRPVLLFVAATLWLLIISGLHLYRFYGFQEKEKSAANEPE